MSASPPPPPPVTYYRAGNGGNYGAAGGSATSLSGVGRQGVIIITYTPIQRSTGPHVSAFLNFCF